MKADNPTISLRNVLFTPFRSYKYEPSLALALAMIVAFTTMLVLLKTLEPALSVSYGVSVLIKGGINVALSAVLFLIVALIYTLVSKLIIGKGQVLLFFKLVSVSLLPAVISMLTLLFLKTIGIINIDFIKEYLELFLLIVGVWSLIIVAGGIRNLYAVSTGKAILVTVLSTILPYALVLLTLFIFLGTIIL